MPSSIWYPYGGGPNALPIYRELADAYVHEDLDPVELPAAEGDLWDPGGTDGVIYRVMFYLVNNDAGGAPSTGTYVGREINSAGGLARPHYWVFDETVPYPGGLGWFGPFYIDGDDAVRGYTAAANDVSIHWDVRRVL